MSQDLPPALTRRAATIHERTNLRQLSIMLREAQHVVGTMQALRDEPMTRLMKLDLLKALECHLEHVVRLNEELQATVRSVS